MLTDALTPPELPPPVLDEELDDELEEELLDEELDEELDDELDEELLLEELELLEDELLDELLELVDPVPPLQFPADGLTPVTRRLSMLAKPALLVAFKLSKLFPACRVTFAVVELFHVVHDPVPAKA